MEGKENFLAEKLCELENKIELKEQALDEQYANFQSDFISTQSRRSALFDEFINEKLTSLEQYQSSFKRNKEDLLNSWEDKFLS